MSAPSGGASSAPQCACTNISIMQLFHELKQQFPGVPDHVVSSTISSHCHDRSACQSRLECEAKNYISHLYPSSSLSAAKKEGKDISFPQQCPNQLLITKEPEKPKIIQVSSIQPQKGVCSFTGKLDENDNQRIAKEELKECLVSQKSLSYQAIGTGSLLSGNGLTDYESSTFHPIENDPKSISAADKRNRYQCNVTDEKSNNCIPDNKSFKIFKSNKVTSDLNKKLKDVPESALHSIEAKDEPNTKLKRPTTLEFTTANPQLSGFDIKTNSASLFPKPQFAEADAFDNRKQVSPTDKGVAGEPLSDQRNQQKQYKYSEKCSDDYGPQPDTYPVNVSVNLNCRMDVGSHGGRPQNSQFSEPRRGNFSPGNYTSVNLTVCTPTSSVHSVPVDDRNPADARQRGFESRVQITVSPASSQPQPLYRGIPAPAPSQGRQHFSPLSQMIPETPPASPIDALLRRQKARLARLQRALVAERGRLACMHREVSVLKGPPPPAASHLRPAVEHLRMQCHRLTRQLDSATADGEFYENIYTGQRPEASGAWQCHVCTFRNHGLLNKCEECGMPRIILGEVLQPLRPLSLFPTPPTPHNSLATPTYSDAHLLADTMGRQTINSDAQVHAS